MPRFQRIRRIVARARDVAKRLGVTRLTLVVVAILVILAGSWGFQESNRPGFCRSCHEMEYHYRTWRASSHHEVPCEECHMRPGFWGMVRTKMHGAYLVAIHVKDKPSEAQIPLVAEVPDEVCLKCHEQTPAEVRYHLIRMTHQRHLERGMACADCHANVVHGGRAPYKNTPSMDSCYRCHDGKQAPNNCGLCHVKLGEIRPPLYNENWVKWHRKNLEDVGRSRCQSCHGEQFCRSCHQTVAPHGAGWVAKHTSTTKQELTQCATCHTPRRGEAMARFCTECHAARRAHGPQYVTTHPQEYRREPEACRRCHEDRFCSECHDISRPHPRGWTSGHGAASREQGRDCTVCHPTRFCEECHTSGRPDSHDSKWARDHGDAAEASAGNCRLCHKTPMCQKCHSRHRPDSHEHKAWSTTHGPLATANSKRCRACHEQQECRKCHGGVQMPHPGGWRKSHRDARVTRDKSRCAVCHTQEACDTCHRGSIPASHEARWLEKHGSASQGQGANCRLCHTERLCSACHALPMPHPEGWAVKEHGKAAQEKPGPCATCHESDDCLQCHATLPPSSHGQDNFDKQHASQGPNGALCALCHGANSCLACHKGVPMPHAQEFKIKQHGPLAQRGPDACAACHESEKECLSCHENLPPSGHQEEAFKEQHGEKANAVLCGLCHGADSCKTCHAKLEKSPHPEKFALEHKTAKFTKDATCLLCHKFEYCQMCHPDAELK